MGNSEKRKVYEYAKDYGNKDVAKEIGKEVGKSFIGAALELIGIWLSSKKTKN